MLLTCSLWNTFAKMYGKRAMDRRKQKTRKAILDAFSELLTKKSYSRISVQEIIDEANVGRTTFYAHFETKDDLLRALCEKLFSHIIQSASDYAHTHGLYSEKNAPLSVFCHLLQHLKEDGRNIIPLLSSSNNDLFIRYFKDSMNELVESSVMKDYRVDDESIPHAFLINHISGSFVEMVLWWITRGMTEKPEELDVYFRAVIEPIL